MLKKITINNLKPGMYIDLSGNWLKHDFLKNKFIISSEEEIKKIAQSGFKEVMIDPARGVAGVDDLDKISHGPEDLEKTDKWDSTRVVTDKLRNAIHDKKLPPEKKASYVYEHSLEIMEKLLESPKAENINAAKEGIADLVDMVLADDETSGYLLQITSHDFYTYTHSVNVGVLSILLSKAMFKNSDAHDMHELGAGFFLHDMGKTKVDYNIINKPGKLTDDEMNIMRIHPYQGYKILEEADQLSEECKIIVMQHHERNDGTGYPRGLEGDDIHVYGRIGCIADVFDALTAERSYKPALKPFDALKLMKEQMLYHFDNELFSKFVLLFK